MPDDALGEQEPLCQFDIRARCPHRHGQRFAVDPDLQRLLDDQRLRARDRIMGSDVAGAPPRGHPAHEFSNRMTIAFDTGVFDLTAVWSSGTSGLVSG